MQSIRRSRGSSSGSDVEPAACWSTLRNTEHEIVDEDELCEHCRQKDVQGFFFSASGWGLPALELSSLQEIVRRNWCWICRFFSRICAQGLSQMDFIEICRTDWRFSIHTCGGWWEDSLLMVGEPNPATCIRMHLERFHDRKRMSEEMWRRLPAFGNDIFITVDTQRPSIMRKIAQLQPLNSYLSSLGFTLIGSWLETCTTHHRSICSASETLLDLPGDFRLIDVKTGSIVVAGANSEYIALSYVRGSFRMSNRTDRSLQNLPSVLPKLIGDALHVVRALGKKYLWVDEYCIDQNDHISLQKNINTMDSIYLGAYLTICVLSESNAEGRIPGVGKPFQGRFQVISENESHRYMATAFKHTFATMRSSPWNDRAWAFQEGSLSRRRLCFHEEGFFLLCQKELFYDLVQFENSESRIKSTPMLSEIYPLGFDIDIKSWDFHDYTRIVAAYSCRTLTFPSDAYNAIAGTLRHITLCTGVEFVFGLPSQDLVNALLWFRHPWDRGYDVHSARRAGFASWTWLGWQARTVYEYWLRPSSSTLPPTAEPKLFLLVRRGASPYRNLVEVRKSCQITWPPCAPGVDPANMIMSTEKAIFAVRCSLQVQSRNMINEDQRRSRWHLLDAAGVSIIRESEEYFGDNHVEFRDRGELATLSMRIDAAISELLSESLTRNLEFVLLQHWSESVGHPVPMHERNAPDLHYSALDLTFNDRVWVMAIRPMPDGSYERLAVIWMPPAIWYAANPKPAVIRLS